MTIRQGETGKVFRVKANYDMSSNTELTLLFYKPDGTTVTKTKTGGVVTLGTSAVSDTDLGTLAANTYVEYILESGFADQSGTWSVYLTYTNTTPNPDANYIGTTSEFEVLPVP